MDAAERDAVLALNLVSGLGPTLTRRCVESFGSASATLAAHAQQLQRVEGIGPQRSGDIRRGIDAVLGNGELEREKDLLAQHHAAVITFDDPQYPKLLQHIPDAPPVLYVRGQVIADDALALAVVGSRKCTAYGREQADRLAALCAQAGLTVVSGGAYGVDAAAHRAALRVKGRTIVVLGSGLARPYPEAHAELFDQVVSAGQGAIVSEMAMNTPPLAENFPRRNRIISGLSLGVLVIEAALRSGALITARLSAEEHGREVMAVPGRVDSLASAGCHKIIREGWATLVTNVADVLDALGETGQLLKAGAPAESADISGGPSLFERNLTESQQRIMGALSEPRTLDQIAAGTALAVATIQADLTMLQIRGLIRRENGMIARKKG